MGLLVYAHSSGRCHVVRVANHSGKQCLNKYVQQIKEHRHINGSRFNFLSPKGPASDLILQGDRLKKYISTTRETKLTPSLDGFTCSIW